MDPFAFYYDEEYARYYKSMEGFLDKHVDFKGKEILCLACGTGHFQKIYVDKGAKFVTCVDLSGAMLAVFKAKMVNRPEYSKKISLVQKDMAKFNFKKRFDIVFLIGNSFCELMTQEQQIACLNRIRKHLKKDGRAYLHILPLSDSMNSDFRLNRSFVDRGGQIIHETARGRMCYPEHRLDFEIQWKSKASVVRKTEPSRLMTTPEMALLLKLTRLKIANIYYDYSKKVNKKAKEWIYEVKK